jgi:hypothetical protein
MKFRQVSLRCRTAAVCRARQTLSRDCASSNCLRAYLTKLEAAKYDRNIVKGETLARLSEQRTKLPIVGALLSMAERGHERSKNGKGNVRKTIPFRFNS